MDVRNLWKIHYKKRGGKWGILCRRQSRLPTPHAKFANAARDDCNFPVWSCQTPHAEFDGKLCGIWRRLVRALYFLCFVPQNILLQPIGFHRKFDLSAFLALGAGKCHASKNNASESVSLGKMFTNQAEQKRRRRRKNKRSFCVFLAYFVPLHPKIKKE